MCVCVCVCVCGIVIVCGWKSCGLAVIVFVCASWLLLFLDAPFTIRNNLIVFSLVRVIAFG